jgi:hypothetical protein
VRSRSVLPGAFALGLCAAALWCDGAAAQVRELPGTRFAAGSWAGWGFRNNSNQYGGCLVVAPRPGRTRLTFAFTTNVNFQMAVTNTAWNLRVGNEYSMAYWVDGQEPLSVTGRATAKDLVEFDLEDSNEVFERFRTGNTLHVLGEGRRVSFSLSGTSAALDRLRECYDRYRAQAQPSQPTQPSRPDTPASGKPAPPRPGSSAEGGKPAARPGGPGVSSRAQ